MAERGIGKKAMAVTYSVEITGIERTKYEMERLDTAIARLRGASYSGKNSTTASATLGTRDLFKTKVIELEGRVQTAAGKSMIAAMDKGVELQGRVLRAATTETGRSGRSHGKGRKGPGREDSGAMIDAISRGVETQRTRSSSLITGYHGWKLGRSSYFMAQEKGKTKRGVIEAANSLGVSIITVREFLKTELRKLKK